MRSVGALTWVSDRHSSGPLTVQSQSSAVRRQAVCSGRATHWQLQHNGRPPPPAMPRT